MQEKRKKTSVQLREWLLIEVKIIAVKTGKSISEIFEEAVIKEHNIKEPTDGQD
jgi:hypothetical protein